MQQHSTVPLWGTAKASHVGILGGRAGRSHGRRKGEVMDEMTQAEVILKLVKRIEQLVRENERLKRKIRKKPK